MAEKSGFFNAKLVSGNYDRTYQAGDFADCLSMFIPNGIYVEDSEMNSEVDKTTVMGLKPSVSGTNLIINTGKAFINGYWYVLDENNLTISLEYGTTKAIVLMYSLSERQIKVELVDWINGDTEVPKTDAKYGILLGKVLYTSSGVVVEDLRTEFMIASPKALQVISERTLQGLEEYNTKVVQQDEKIKKIEDGVIVGIDIRKSEFSERFNQILGTYYEATIAVGNSIGAILSAVSCKNGNIATMESMLQTTLTDLKNHSADLAFSWQRKDGGIIKIQITNGVYRLITSAGFITVYGGIVD